VAAASSAGAYHELTRCAIAILDANPEDTDEVEKCVTDFTIRRSLLPLTGDCRDEYVKFTLHAKRLKAGYAYDDVGDQDAARGFNYQTTCWENPHSAPCVRLNSGLLNDFNFAAGYSMDYKACTSYQVRHNNIESPDWYIFDSMIHKSWPVA